MGGTERRRSPKRGKGQLGDGERGWGGIRGGGGKKRRERGKTTHHAGDGGPCFCCC